MDALHFTNLAESTGLTPALKDAKKLLNKAPVVYW